MKKLLFTGLLLSSIYAEKAFGQAYGNAYDNQLIQANSRHNDLYYNKPAFKFEAQAGNPGRGGMTFDINVLTNVKPDSYVAMFNITQVGETASATDSLASSRIESFKKDLVQYGVEESDILTDMISFIPVYEVQVEKKLFSKTYNEVPKGFELQKNVHVRFKDINKLDKLLAAAARNEIYDFIKVDYFIENTLEIWDKMMNRTAEFLTKKKSFYKKIGYDLDSMNLDIADDQNIAFPADRYKSYTAFNQTSIDAIKKKHDVVESKKQVTKYYSKLPYHRYDAVMNPEILEPAVQFTYSLKLSYTKKPEKPKVVEKVKEVKKHFFISESGDAKVIPLN